MEPKRRTEADGADVLPLLTGELSTALRPADIPAAPDYDLGALKANDPEPVEVVVAVPASVSTRRWKYTPQAMQAIVAHVQSHGLPGFLGHQKAEDLAHQFPEPVTHWIGAVWNPGDGEDGTAYFRGVVDPGAPKLKRWLKARTIRQVSIFGHPELRRSAGGKGGAHQEVVGYSPLSLDWTPLNRSGMVTRVVALGEQGGQDGDNDGKQEGREMTLAELLGELRKTGATPAQVIGELRWTPEAVGEAIALDVRAAQSALSERGKVRDALGLPADAPQDDVLRAVKAGTDATADRAKRDQEAALDKILTDLVPQEKSRPLVRRLLASKLQPGADEAQIRGAVTGLLAEEDVKAALEVLGGPQDGTEEKGAAGGTQEKAGAGGSAGEQSGRTSAGWTTPRPATDNRQPQPGQLPAGFSYGTQRI